MRVLQEQPMLTTTSIVRSFLGGFTSRESSMESSTKHRPNMTGADGIVAGT